MDQWLDLDEQEPERVAREERLTAADDDSEHVMRRFQTRATARSELARRISAMAETERPGETSEEEKAKSGETNPLVPR